MIRIGVTGHIATAQPARRLIYRELVAELRRHRPLHGVTCLAEGTDRLFAEAVRACRGTFEAVLPVPELAASPEGDRALRNLLRSATDLTRITVPGPPELSYEAAGREVVDRSDMLIAVWDGRATGARGGTAETVAWALACGKAVRRVWPSGASRLRLATPVLVG